MDENNKQDTKPTSSQPNVPDNTVQNAAPDSPIPEANGQQISTKTNEIVELLKQCKQQDKSFYDATKFIQQKGYTAEEIEDASYQFPYTAQSASDIQDDEMDVQSANEIAERTAKQQSVMSSWIRTLFGGRFR